MARSYTPTPSDRSTSTRNQETFRCKLFDRDGVVSLIGKVLDTQSYPPPPGMTYFTRATLQGLRKPLFIFAGQSLETLLTGSQIRDPSNGLLLDVLTHELFASFRFGIECRDKIYRLRKLYPDRALSDQLARHNDEEELLFGWKFSLGSSSFSTVLRVSNAFSMISAILGDEEEFNSGNTDGDYWLVTGATYLERKLRGLAASNYSDHYGPDEEERLML
ncbi:hypothetical protein V1506DRAFT_555917 [Lipomyces tetrasporus]